VEYVRILSIHADILWYRITRKTKIAEPVTVREDEMKECVVLFSCVEKLDERDPRYVIRSARDSILKRLGQLKVNRVMIFPYAHLTSTLGSPDCALTILKGLEEELRNHSVDVKRAPFGWYKEFGIQGKGHPLADLSMTICPYEGGVCDFQCPYCKNPIREADARVHDPPPDIPGYPAAGERTGKAPEGRQ
jgi:threonyl-tRNA synthetase